MNQENYSIDASCSDDNPVAPSFLQQPAVINDDVIAHLQIDN